MLNNQTGHTRDNSLVMKPSKKQLILGGWYNMGYVLEASAVVNIYAFQQESLNALHTLNP